MFDSYSQGICSRERLDIQRKCDGSQCALNWDFWKKFMVLCMYYVVFMPVTLLASKLELLNITNRLPACEGRCVLFGYFSFCTHILYVGCETSI